MEVAVTVVAVVFLYHIRDNWHRFRRYKRTRPAPITFLKRGVLSMCPPLGKLLLCLVAFAVIWPILATIAAVLFPIIIIILALYFYWFCKKETKTND